jgi:riboflavin biosynthesis pyrimidine reductase
MATDDVFEPLESLLTSRHGREVLLPGRLKKLYGRFWFAKQHSPVTFFSNFVTTLDGVVSLRSPGHLNGGDISGFSGQDRMVMGLVRAMADAVIVGSGTLAADRNHVWTPEAICPELARDYAALRQQLGKSQAPLNVIVSGSGAVDLRLPVFSSGKTRVLIVTTSAGAKRIVRQKTSDFVEVHALRTIGPAISANAIANAVCRIGGIDRILVEGGPRLLADFFSQRLIQTQFLTLAPQIAGRGPQSDRPGMIMGRVFAPRHPLWGQLIDVRVGAKNMFLRYSFPGVRP